MLRIRQLFSRQGIDQSLLALQNRSPKSVLILASIVAGSGYFLLGLIPLLTLIGVLKILGGFAAADSISTWLHLFMWVLITAACAVISFTLIRVKTILPSGLGLKADKAPKLYELLAELGEDYKLPRIDRLVIHEKFTLEMIPVPRFGLPLLTTNVLYIGLPILQGLSPAEFRGALARVLGQYSAEQSKKTHWIYRWHQYAQQYLRAYRKHKAPIYKPLQWFYKLYVPLLQYISAGVLRADELEGDIYMLQVMNDREAADVIIRYEISQAFLKNKYWPKIYALLRKNPGNPEHTPHVNMAKVMRNGLTENEFAQTMKDLINRETAWRDTKPNLYARLENIGQRKLDMPPPVMETAAQRYLGDAFGAVLKLLDKQWLAKYSNLAPEGKKNPAAKAAPTTKSEAVRSQVTDRTQAPVVTTEPTYQTDPSNAITHDRLPNISSEEGSTITVAERRRLAELKQKAEGKGLNDNDAWELAYLTEKLEDKSLAITLYQQILKKNPNHAKTLFAVGRILITRNDASGVKALERAMELDKGCIAQGCWMLAKYYKACGDDARAKEYLERAANISFAA